jgi:hypothetical protein
LGAGRDVGQEFERRGLSLENPPLEQVAGLLPTTQALVIRYSLGKPTAFLRYVREIVELAINHGLLVYAIADDPDGQASVRAMLNEARLARHVTERTSPPAYEIAEAIARHDRGPSYRAEVEIVLDAKDLRLENTEELLLKRAFSDCRRIRLEPLPGGRSARVFCVHAVFLDSVAGPRPLPFFAKIDGVEKIEAERTNYSLFAQHFIPFNMRPNLETRRCLLGVRTGILVGNFVEQSEPLSHAAVRGLAQAAIASLFDNTLRGWRLQAELIDGDMLEVIRSLFDPARVPSERVARARAHGATKSPRELADLLEEVAPRRYWRAPMHADLHGLNVRVRGGDAILIDFASTRLGPLVADAASLEVSLAFEAGAHDEDNEGWRETIDRLYERELIERAPPPAIEPSKREWLWTAVRQIRLIALAQGVSAPDEYATALAVYLLRRSMYEGQSESDEFRRAHAYTVAERILQEMAAKRRGRG